MSDDAIKAAWATSTQQLRGLYQGDPEEFDSDMNVEYSWFCRGYELGAKQADGAQMGLAQALHSYITEESAAHRQAKLVGLRGMLRKMGFR